MTIEEKMDRIAEIALVLEAVAEEQAVVLTHKQAGKLAAALFQRGLDIVRGPR